MLTTFKRASLPVPTPTEIKTVLDSTSGQAWRAAGAKLSEMEGKLSTARAGLAALLNRPEVEDTLEAAAARVLTGETLEALKPRADIEEARRQVAVMERAVTIAQNDLNRLRGELGGQIRLSTAQASKDRARRINAALSEIEKAHEEEAVLYDAIARHDLKGSSVRFVAFGASDFATDIADWRKENLDNGN